MFKGDILSGGLQIIYGRLFIRVFPGTAEVGLTLSGMRGVVM
jgi:hypothetical protein